MSKIRSTARVAVAHRLAGELNAAEAAVDAAFAKVAHLAAAIPAARLEASLSAVVGQPVFFRLAEGMEALAQARARLVDAHSELTKVGDQIGLSHVVAHGPLDKSETETAPTLLTVVKRA